jgi:ABC-type antimicrobial peptide transport system permease subunit
VRTSTEPTTLAAAIRDRIRRVDADVPASSFQTMSARVSASVARPRLHAVVLSSFAGLALLLAAMGIYGVVSHAAEQRTREVGIRMAVGASARAILALFLREGIAMAALGVTAGLVIAAGVTRALRTLLFEVSPTDPLVFVAIAVLLSVVAVAAAWIPARRATRLDPLAALRED